MSLKIPTTNRINRNNEKLSQRRLLSKVGWLLGVVALSLGGTHKLKKRTDKIDKKLPKLIIEIINEMTNADFPLKLVVIEINKALW